MAEQTCKHCGQRIQQRNFALGKSWVHITGCGFSDYETYCRRTVAEPATEDS